MQELYAKALENITSKNGANSTEEKILKANALISRQVKVFNTEDDIVKFCIQLMHDIDINKGRGNSHGVGTSYEYTTIGELEQAQLRNIIQNYPNILPKLKAAMENENFSQQTKDLNAILAHDSSGSQGTSITITDTKQEHLDLINNTTIISSTASDYAMSYTDENGNKVEVTDPAAKKFVKDMYKKSLSEFRKYVAELKREADLQIGSEGLVADAANAAATFSGIGTSRSSLKNQYYEMNGLLKQFEAAIEGKLRDSNGNVVSPEELANKIHEQIEKLAQTNSDYAQSQGYWKMGIVLAPIIAVTSLISRAAAAGILKFGAMVSTTGLMTAGFSELDMRTSAQGVTDEGRDAQFEEALTASMFVVGGAGIGKAGQAMIQCLLKSGSKFGKLFANAGVQKITITAVDVSGNAALAAANETMIHGEFTEEGIVFAATFALIGGSLHMQKIEPKSSLTASTAAWKKMYKKGKFSNEDLIKEYNNSKGQLKRRSAIEDILRDRSANFEILTDGSIKLKQPATTPKPAEAPKPTTPKPESTTTQPKPATANNGMESYIRIDENGNAIIKPGYEGEGDLLSSTHPDDAAFWGNRGNGNSWIRRTWDRLTGRNTSISPKVREGLKELKRETSIDELPAQEQTEAIINDMKKARKLLKKARTEADVKAIEEQLKGNGWSAEEISSFNALKKAYKKFTKPAENTVTPETSKPGEEVTGAHEPTETQPKPTETTSGTASEGDGAPVTTKPNSSTEVTGQPGSGTPKISVWQKVKNFVSHPAKTTKKAVQDYRAQKRHTETVKLNDGTKAKIVTDPATGNYTLSFKNEYGSRVVQEYKLSSDGNTHYLASETITGKYRGTASKLKGKKWQEHFEYDSNGNCTSYSESSRNSRLGKYEETYSEIAEYKDGQFVKSVIKRDGKLAEVRTLEEGDIVGRDADGNVLYVEDGEFTFTYRDGKLNQVSTGQGYKKHNFLNYDKGDLHFDDLNGNHYCIKEDGSAVIIDDVSKTETPIDVNTAKQTLENVYGKRLKAPERKVFDEATTVNDGAPAENTAKPEVNNNIEERFRRTSNEFIEDELYREVGNGGNSGNPEYIQASKETREFFNSAIENGEYLNSSESYMQTIKKAHKIACNGKDGNLDWYGPKSGRQGRIENIPGEFCTDRPVAPRQTTAPEIETIAKKYNDKFNVSETSSVELEGIDKKYRPLNTGTDDGGISHFYPEPESYPQYFKQMHRTASEAMELIKKSAPQDEILAKLAEHYQYAANVRCFGQVNNSLFMNEINTLLKEAGMKPMPHGKLDYAAQCLQPKAFREYFIDTYKSTALDAPKPNHVGGDRAPVGSDRHTPKAPKQEVQPLTRERIEDIRKNTPKKDIIETQDGNKTTRVYKNKKGEEVLREEINGNTTTIKDANGYKMTEITDANRRTKEVNVFDPDGNPLSSERFEKGDDGKWTKVSESRYEGDIEYEYKLDKEGNTTQLFVDDGNIIYHYKDGKLINISNNDGIIDNIVVKEGKVEFELNGKNSLSVDEFKTKYCQGKDLFNAPKPEPLSATKPVTNTTNSSGDVPVAKLKKEQLLAEHNRIKEEIAKNESALVEAEKKVADAEAKLKDAQRKLDEADQKVQETAELEQTPENNEQLETDLGEVDRLSKEVDTAKNEYDNQVNARDEIKKKVENLKTEDSEVLDELNSKSSKFRKLNNELRKSTKEVESVENEINNLKLKKENLERAIKEEQAAKKEVELLKEYLNREGISDTEIIDVKNRLERAKEKLAQKTDAKNTAQEEMDKVGNYNDAMKALEERKKIAIEKQKVAQKAVDDYNPNDDTKFENTIDWVKAHKKVIIGSTVGLGAAAVGEWVNNSETPNGDGHGTTPVATTPTTPVTPTKPTEAPEVQETPEAPEDPEATAVPEATGDPEVTETAPVTPTGATPVAGNTGTPGSPNSTTPVSGTTGTPVTTTPVTGTTGTPVSGTTPTVTPSENDGTHSEQEIMKIRQQVLDAVKSGDEEEIADALRGLRAMGPFKGRKNLRRLLKNARRLNNDVQKGNDKKIAKHQKKVEKYGEASTKDFKLNIDKDNKKVEIGFSGLNDDVQRNMDEQYEDLSDKKKAKVNKKFGL